MHCRVQNIRVDVLKQAQRNDHEELYYLASQAKDCNQSESLLYSAVVLVIIIIT